MYMNMEIPHAHVQYFPQITIPRDDTTYWCAGIRLPQEMRSSVKHLIKVICGICILEFFKLERLSSEIQTWGRQSIKFQTQITFYIK